MTSLTHNTRASRLVYRVRHVPAYIREKHGPEGLSTLLSGALGDIEPHEVHVRSLVASASAYDEDQVATVTFKKTPELLGDKKGQWSIKPARFPLGHSLLIDTHFRGLTALSGLHGATCE